jgi:hypothetical protein
VPPSTQYQYFLVNVTLASHGVYMSKIVLVARLLAGSSNRKEKIASKDDHIRLFD